MKKKVIISLAATATVFCCAFGFAACGETDGGGANHTHTYATEWGKDETHHWRAATCEHTDEIKDKAEHTFDDVTLSDFNATVPACTVCYYTAHADYLCNAATFRSALDNEPTSYRASWNYTSEDAATKFELNENAYHLANTSDVGGEDSYYVKDGSSYKKYSSNGVDGLYYQSTEEESYVDENKYAALADLKELDSSFSSFTYDKENHAYTARSVAVDGATLSNVVLKFEGGELISASYRYLATSNYDAEIYIEDVNIGYPWDNDSDYYFTFNDDGVTLTGLKADAEEIIIPDSLNVGGTDYNVTKISALTVYTPQNGGASYTSAPNTATSITVSANVRSISRGICGGALEQITFADGSKLESIGAETFQNCTALTSITIPESVTSIGDNAFTGCPIENATIPMSALGKISKNNLKTLVLTGEGTSIAASAFEGCTMLTSITIPEGVTRIGNNAFKGCTALKNITIPKSVTNIGDNVFTGCPLENATIPMSALSEISKDNLKTLVLTGAGTDIAASAFEGCTSLTSITIPEGATSIGENAFKGCTSLTSITIPESVTSIGAEAFRSCSSLTDVTIPKGVTRIDEYTFSSCSSLTDVTIPDGVKSIFNSAFYGCTSLITVTIPNSVTSISDNAFAYCTSLTSFKIGSGVTSMGFVLFECPSLTDITVDEHNANFKSVDGNLYTKDGTGLCVYAAGKTDASFVVPDGVEYIRGYAFSMCGSLTSITIPSSAEQILDYAFDNCYKLIEIHNLSKISIYPDSYGNGRVALYAKNVYSSSSGNSRLVTADGYIFYDGTANEEGYYLVGYAGTETELTLPDDVNGNDYAIYQYAFWNRSSITSIAISKGVTDIGRYAFSGCTSLANIAVDENNANYKSAGGNLYSKDGTTLIQYAIGKTDTSFAISEGVTSIGDYAFEDCKSLTSVTMESVASIGESAFEDCKSLTSVTLSESVTSIKGYAFSGCTSLASVTFENTNGWWYEQSSNKVNIASTDLADASTAAEYLTSTYTYYHWGRD